MSEQATTKYCPFCGAAALVVARRFVFACGACGLEFAIASPQFVDAMVAAQRVTDGDLRQPLPNTVVPSITSDRTGGVSK